MTTYTLNGNKANVYHDKERAFWGCEPWIATWDGYDGAPIDYDTPSKCPVGEGYTEQEAIDDLLEKSE